jgi:predicted transcriptional regulator YheO
MTKTFVELLIPLVDALAETFGKNWEVVLHDFYNLSRKREHFIVEGSISISACFQEMLPCFCYYRIP